jgi:hypothetical protein
MQREREQSKVAEVLAGEELRHMDLIARKREAEVGAACCTLCVASMCILSRRVEGCSYTCKVAECCCAHLVSVPQMRGRMQEAERLIRDERMRIEKLKETRQQRLKVRRLTSVCLCVCVCVLACAYP